MGQSREEIKASRTFLRRIEQQRAQAALDCGAQPETINLVTVVHHPTDVSPALNYVTPRKGTAWVTMEALKDGLARLGELDREPHFVYLEGLIPAFFRQRLVEIGLELLQDDPIFDPEIDDDDSPPVGRLVVFGAPRGAARKNLHEWMAQSVPEES